MRPDVSVVAANHALNRGKADSCSSEYILIVQACEGFEQSAGEIGIEAGAIVSDTVDAAPVVVAVEGSHPAADEEREVACVAVVDPAAVGDEPRRASSGRPGPSGATAGCRAQRQRRRGGPRRDPPHERIEPRGGRLPPARVTIGVDTGASGGGR